MCCCGGCFGSACCQECCDLNDDQRNLFCSQLGAEIYQAVGIIPTTIDTSSFAPVDFLGYDKDGTKNLVHIPIYLKTEKH